MMTDDRLYDEERIAGIDRRKFIVVGGGVGAALLAGCTSDDPSGNDSPDGSDGTDTPAGDAASFRLLVSDAPADIGDFDRLDVTLDSARVFEGGDEGESTETEEGTDTEDGTETDAENGTATETSGEMTESVEEDEQQTGEDETATENGTATDGADGGEGGEEEGADDEDDGEDRGFYVLDLDDPTVDLTKVVGDKAVAVFDGELSEGSYQKLELNVADVEGIVDGEAVEVKVPSEKLQLTKSFEVRAGEELDFVFDINVVKRGNQASYNLKPVISQSGVRGKDVEVEEVGDESGEGESESEDGSDDGTEEADDSEGENSTDDTDDAGTETEADSDDGGADAGNETDGTAGNESSA
ncbi:DUF4382 domain-containing protein [Natronomonas salina]|uniref:DUF4382 domain-containing protein n=1 Tax=Natronomonas salina TaxID=1710540 RepID=UPI0015B75427|nr:DUF4382 domain-containing protein [Natronomonas salina]QLD90722.1 DUF4382 domain-containing protein [Natronomonas salina]